MNTYSTMLKRTLSALFALVLCSQATRLGATDYRVSMTSNFSFSPNYLVIAVGDTVTWVNDDYYDDHDSSSVNGYWYSGLLAPGDSWSLTFPYVGTFQYEDTYWYMLGMTGVVIVKVPIVPPPVSLLAPQFLPDGSFQCVVSNLTVGQPYMIQTSTNLVDWTDVFITTASSSTETYVDAMAANFDRQFYRCYQQPYVQ